MPTLASQKASIACESKMRIKYASMKTKSLLIDATQGFMKANFLKRNADY